MQPFGPQHVPVPSAATGPAPPRAPGAPRPPAGSVRPALPPGTPLLEYESALTGKQKWKPRLWQFLIAGYTTFGRSFAYLGVRPLFIGELYLAYNIVRNEGKWINRFIRDLFDLKLLPLSITLLLLWGLFEVARPVLAGASVKECLRTCAFNYYPLYIPIGIAIGRRLMLSEFMRFWKWLAVYWVIYAVVFAVYGNANNRTAPWAGNVMLFMGPSLAPLVPVGMLALWPLMAGWSWRWVILPMSMIPMFFGSGRGTILGFVASLMVVAASSLRRLLLVGGLVGVILVLLLIIGPYIKGSDDRSETWDPTISLARIIATFDEETAYRMLLRRGYYSAAEEMLFAKGSANWRSTIWMNAINSLDTTTLLILGQGHGESILDLTPDGQDIHTPHNFAIYAIYYTGFAGLAFFSFMLLALILATRRVPDPSLRSFQLAHMAMMVIVAAVGNMFETPIAAVPFYLLSGIVVGVGSAMPRGRYA